MNRREMLLTAGVGAAALLLPRTVWADEAKSGFALADLPYDFDALEPIIDRETMMIHHGKHHQAYVDNLNKALAGHEEWLKLPIETVVSKVVEIEDMKLRKAVMNNGGGHFNHTFFWQIMAPRGQGGKPAGAVAAAIEKFGGMEKLQAAVLEKATGQFGSGWAWVVVNKTHELDVLSTPNQDNPLMAGNKPIIGIDVWEHAYYLKYRNRRADYVKAWWELANWKAIGQYFDQAHGA